jgi:hypothetical protein
MGNLRLSLEIEIDNTTHAVRVVNPQVVEARPQPVVVTDPPDRLAVRSSPALMIDPVITGARCQHQGCTQPVFKPRRKFCSTACYRKNHDKLHANTMTPGSPGNRAIPDASYKPAGRTLSYRDFTFPNL